MFDCPDILREFLFYLETIQGRSPKTVNGYYIELRTFLRYLKSVKVLKKLPQDAEELAQIKIDDVTKELVCSVTFSIFRWTSWATAPPAVRARLRPSARCTNI